MSNSLKDRRYSRSFSALSSRPRLSATTKAAADSDLFNSHVKSKYNEILESSRRTLAYCKESKKAGELTAQILQEQDERLDRADRNINTVNSDMYTIEENFSYLRKNKCCHQIAAVSCFGCFWCLQCCVNRSDPMLSDFESSQPPLSEKKQGFLKWPPFQGKARGVTSESNVSVYSNLNLNTIKIEKVREISANSLSDRQAKVCSSNSYSSSFMRRVRQSMEGLKNSRSVTSLKRLLTGGKLKGSQRQAVAEVDEVSLIKKQLDETLCNINAELNSMQMMTIDLGMAIHRQNDKLARMDKFVDLAVNRVKIVDSEAAETATSDDDDDELRKSRKRTFGFFSRFFR